MPAREARQRSATAARSRAASPYSRATKAARAARGATISILGASPSPATAPAGSCRSPILLDSASTTVTVAGSSASSRASSRLSNSFWLGWARRRGRRTTSRDAPASSSRSSVCTPHSASAPQNRGLARSGVAVQQQQPVRQITLVQGRVHPPPPRPVAANRHRHAPADLIEDGRHRARPLAAAPAIDQRPPRRRPLGQRPPPDAGRCCARSAPRPAAAP